MSIQTGKLPVMSLRYALLGLLHDCPATGYDLTQRFTQGMGRIAWNAKHSQIYPELHKLTEEGLIEVVAEGARGKRVYGPTEAGGAALREWLLREPEDGTVRNPLLLRVFMVGGLEPDDATQALERIQRYANEMVEELTETHARVTAETAEPPASAYAAMYGIYSYRAMQEWAKWAIEEQRKRVD